MADIWFFIQANLDYLMLLSALFCSIGLGIWAYFHYASWRWAIFVACLFLAAFLFIWYVLLPMLGVRGGLECHDTF
jgi:hypothetical protein